MKILLDTHTLLWFKKGSDDLSASAKHLIEQNHDVKEVLVSSFSIWEIAILIRKRKIVLPVSLKDFVTDVRNQPQVRIIDVSPEIAIESCNLPGKFHGDPGDQILVATARLENALMVTRDRQIQNYGYVKSVW